MASIVPANGVVQDKAMKMTRSGWQVAGAIAAGVAMFGLALVAVDFMGRGFVDSLAPIAVLLLTRRPRSSAGAQRQPRPVPARVARWLGVLSLAWFAPIFGALLLSPVTGTPWWRAIPLGLVERGLVISEVLAVIALGIWVLHATGRRTTRLGSAPNNPTNATKQPRNPRPATPAQTGPAA